MTQSLMLDVRSSSRWWAIGSACESKPKCVMDHSIFWKDLILSVVSRRGKNLALTTNKKINNNIITWAWDFEGSDERTSVDEESSTNNGGNRWRWWFDRMRVKWASFSWPAQLTGPLGERLCVEISRRMELFSVERNFVGSYWSNAIQEPRH